MMVHNDTVVDPITELLICSIALSLKTCLPEYSQHIQRMPV